MSRKDWVKTNKNTPQAGNAVKKEKTLDEKKNLVQKEKTGVRQSTVKKAVKKAARKQEADPSEKKAKHSVVKKAAKVSKTAVKGAAAAGMLAAGKAISDAQSEADGTVEQNLAGLIGVQALQSIRSEKEPDKEKKQRAENLQQEAVKPEESMRQNVVKPEESMRQHVAKAGEDKRQEAVKPEEGKRQEAVKPEEGKRQEAARPENKAVQEADEKIKDRKAEIGKKAGAAAGRKLKEAAKTSVKNSAIRAAAAAGRAEESAERGTGSNAGESAFSTMADQMYRTNQMAESTGKATEKFKEYILNNWKKDLPAEEKAKRCNVSTGRSMSRSVVQQDPQMARRHVEAPERKEKKIYRKAEREEGKKRKKGKKKGKDGKSGTGKINKLQRTAAILTAVFNGDMAENLMNALKVGAPVMVFVSAIFTGLVAILGLFNGFAMTAAEAARHPVSFFLETSEEETTSEDYIRAAVKKKEADFDKALQDFLEEDPEYHMVLYDGGKSPDWAVWENDICIAYLARAFIKLENGAISEGEASYPLLHVDSEEKRGVLDEVFSILHFYEDKEEEIQVADGTESIEKEKISTQGDKLEGIQIRDHICGFSHRKDYAEWDKRSIPCLAAEKSGFELGTVVQICSNGSRPGLKYQIVGYDDSLEENEISVCQNLKQNITLYPRRDLTVIIIKGKRTQVEYEEQIKYKTVTKTTRTVYNYSLSDWQAGIKGNYPSDEESEVIDDMYSMLKD